MYRNIIQPELNNPGLVVACPPANPVTTSHFDTIDGDDLR